MAATKRSVKSKTATKKATTAKPAWMAKPKTVPAFLASLTPEKRAVVSAARKLVKANISDGYAEFMSWGGINWGIPLTEFADTYNGHPLTYIALCANKHNVTLHLMGCYGDINQIAFMKEEFKKAGKKFDMGKACLHFKKMDDLELKSVAKVIRMVSPSKFLAHYKKVKGL